MSDLPTGWRRLPLADIAEVCLGKMLDKKRTSGVRMRYLRNINVRWGHVDCSDLFTMPFQAHELERFGLRHGDVLVCEGGEPGRAAVWTGDAGDLKFQKALHRVRLNSDVDPRWLVHQLFLDAHQGALSEHLTGTTIRHFTGEAIKTYQVVVPPLDAQHAIVAAIESHFSRLDAATATLERVQRNLERYRASVLKAAVEGRLVPTEAELAKKEGRSYEPASVLLKRILAERRRRWEEAELAKLNAKGKPPSDDKWKAKYEEPAAPDTADLPKLPEGWCWSSLDQVTSESLIGLVRSQTEQSPSAPFAYVKMDQINMEGTVDLAADRSTHVSASPEEAERYALRDGDILFNTRNSAELVGKSAIVRSPLPGTLFNNNIMRIRVSTFVTSSFLAHFMLSQPFRDQISRVKKATTSVAAVYGRDLFPCAIAIPPLPEQARIASALDRQLSDVRQSRSALVMTSARVARLRLSILKWAFEGRLVGGPSTFSDAQQPSAAHSVVNGGR